MQSEADALFVESIAVLLQSDLDPWVLVIEVDLVSRYRAVCAVHWFAMLNQLGVAAFEHRRTELARA